MTNLYKNVLVIDDNEADQLLARKLMQIAGFAEDVSIKDSRQSALDYLSEARKHPADVPDIIFVDINRPAIDGFSFLKAYDAMPQGFKKRCTLVVLSSSHNRHNIDGVYGYNEVKAILPKPLTIDAILKLTKQTGQA